MCCCGGYCKVNPDSHYAGGGVSGVLNVSQVFYFHESTAITQYANPHSHLKDFSRSCAGHGLRWRISL